MVKLNFIVDKPNIKHKPSTFTKKYSVWWKVIKISCSRSSIVHLLLTTADFIEGADINAQTEETQETALTLACCGGFLEVADFLIKVRLIHDKKNQWKCIDSPQSS